MNEVKTGARAFLGGLAELSSNLWWSWDPEASGVMGEVHARGMRAASADPALAKRLASALVRLRRLRAAAKPPAGLSAREPVAYFSMEFGVHESLRVYAGGLGILAGDHAKSSSDEGVPLTGVGLFYHNGYFRQELDLSGKQRVVYPKANVRELPLQAARDARGRELRIPVELPDRVIRLKVWRVQVGRVDLLLLDSDVPENRKEDRHITYRLYGGSREDRIRQEVAAGIGGVRALRALGMSPGVWHLNEGHVAFLTLERLRELRAASRLSFEEAVEVVAADTVFTTHTPVPEGNEAFDLALARKYLARHAEAAGIQLEDYLALGLDRAAGGRPFLSMTVLALRLSRFRNGVSKLHGEVSRRMWSKFWPGFRAEDVPITSVTNGVHTRTWVSPRMDSLLKAHVGRAWDRRLDDFTFWKRASRLPERSLWEAKQASKREMVAFVRDREVARLARLGVPERRRRAAAERLLDPEAFTIGFARRFALYKRAALLFRDLERARRIFGSKSRPVQIVFSGKPHPEDAQGKALFEQIAAISGKPGLRGKIALVENYDIEVARHLVQGVDVWLNNPRRPLEASGTSGQKVPINAGLNVSILDGWWCEGYSAQTGWAFGQPVEYGDLDRQDDEDAESLYRVLEKQVLPFYYRRDASGMPRDWFRLVKRSMADLVPRFSTSHMVLEYARRLYKPALENGRAVRAARASVARDLTAWRKMVEKRWPFVHVRSAKRSGSAVEAEVFLAGIDPAGIACRDDRGRDLEVRRLEDLGSGVHRVAVRGASGGALRLYPTHPCLVAPVELGLSISIEV